CTDDKCLVLVACIPERVVLPDTLDTYTRARRLFIRHPLDGWIASQQPLVSRPERLSISKPDDSESKVFGPNESASQCNEKCANTALKNGPNPERSQHQNEHKEAAAAATATEATEASNTMSATSIVGAGEARINCKLGPRHRLSSRIRGTDKPAYNSMNEWTTLRWSRGVRRGRHRIVVIVNKNIIITLITLTAVMSHCESVGQHPS
ncbi:hypothetical protein GZH46_03001, partial [Fragariocoptes setiger]